MFARPRQRIPVPPPKKKRKLASAIEEIFFDPSAREDYLTGFHKRKLQRIKYAKEEAAKKEKEEKLTARRILREGRKADLEKHVEAVNSMLRNEDGVLSDSSEQAGSGVEEQWEGINEEKVIDHEDAYVDDDRFTSITIEAVDVSRDGLRKVEQQAETDSLTLEAEAPGGTGGDSAREVQTGPEKGKRIWTKDQAKGIKKKKKKFKYESKAERKVTRHKEKSGNRASAKARKGR